MVCGFSFLQPFFVYSHFLFVTTFSLWLLSGGFCCLLQALQCLYTAPCTVRPNPQLGTVPNRAGQIRYMSMFFVLFWLHSKEVLLLFLSSCLAY